ncbi:trypsin domain-containing protein [Phthorimaea operculella]|nr:trypsin domain-containing protein [Phthorimaea operculella]
MGVKVGILLIAAFVGCLADPLPQNDFFDNELYYHTDPNSRIVGGSQAAQGSHPHMVALTQGALVRSLLCGGSIIGQRSILTAAHCINAVYNRGSLVNSLRATVGTNRWNSGGRTLSLSRNITHPNYLQASIKNDIGILVTSSDIVVSNTVRPIALDFNFVGANVAARAAGWGRTRQGGAFSATLLELVIPTIEGQRCVTEVAAAVIQNNIRNAPTVEPHIEICTLHAAPNHGTCQGDSGSALVRVDNGQQIGLVSWGIPCARSAPDMFVRISAFRDWLLQNIV